MSKNNWILLGISITVVLIIAFFYFDYESETGEQTPPIEEVNTESISTPTPKSEPDAFIPTSEPETKEFNIIAKQFEFVPETITVNQGDQVKLTITTADVTHGLRITEYGVNERIEPGKTTIIEFNADKKGEFSMACSVSCGSGHGSMRGKLIVI